MNGSSATSSLRDGDRVVDVGCGPGLYVRRLRARPSGCRSWCRSTSRRGWCARREGVSSATSQRLPLRERGRRRGPGGALPVPRGRHPGGSRRAASRRPTGRRRARDHERHATPRAGSRAHRRGGRGRPHPEARATASRWRTHRPSSRVAFGSIELDEVAARIVFDDPEPIVRFVDSCEEFYAPAVRVDWPIVLDRVRGAVAAEIANGGRSRWTPRAASSSAAPGDSTVQASRRKPIFIVTWNSSTLPSEIEPRVSRTSNHSSPRKRLRRPGDAVAHGLVDALATRSRRPR